MGRTYKGYSDDQCHRVLSAAKDGGNWPLVAEHNGVPYPTAWGWVNKARATNIWTPVVDRRGGARRVKIIPEHVEHMVLLLEDNCQLTLFDLVEELKVKFNVDVALQTVHNALNALCYTLKKIHAEPSDMNTDRVKALQRKYVSDIMQVQAQCKRIIYFDETNFNLFCTRSVGWSRRGSRAVVVHPGPRGDNLSIIACVSASGLEHVQYRWGTNNAEAIVRELLDGLMDQGVSLFDVVVVCDNASIHASVNEVTRLSDYSEVKAYLAAHRDDILRVPQHLTEAQHRANFILLAPKHSMATKVTPELCDSEADHTLSFDACALDMENMPVGS
ncbi:hypothetical protein PR002_g6285 [Phytophthora rubi]|uniref:Tc1-like transposase DDE domain-containing protein n=1 Tax=Phytophthora rubi TaxID=129364 RepID=A0A6A3N1H7_9STRA|nr:hypothetical protein PR002_g6285 [Phytophthora rubi]